MRRILTALFVLMGLVASRAARADGMPAFLKPQIDVMRLDNGLTMVVEEDHRLPVVAMHLRYAVGSRDDPRGKEGLAALTERMMMHATQHLPDGGYAKLLAHAGASDVGDGAGSDGTYFWVTVPSNALEQVLWLWSEQMGFFVPRVDRALLDAQRAEMRRERAESVEGVAYGRVHELADAAMFPADHPYNAAHADLQHLDAVTVDDVKAFFDTRYAPSTAVLAIAGDVTPSSARALVTKYFGPIRPSSPPDRRAPQASLERSVRVDVAANVYAPRVVMEWHTPAFYAPGDAALDVVARLLAGRRVAFLYWKLIDDLNVARDVSARQHSRDLGSVFEIQATVAEGHTPDEVIAAIDGVLDQLRTNVVDDRLFQNAVTDMVLPRVLSFERAQERARLYADYVARGGDATYLEHDLRRYVRLTGESVRQIAERYLRRDRRLVLVVTPSDRAPVSGVRTSAPGGAP